jgi:glycopeptide antibiotics resistance protein
LPPRSTTTNGAEGAHIFEALLLTFLLDEHTFRGAFDINDIIYNSVGTAIGLYIMKYCKKRRSKK